jgi:hypothetical protein
LQTEWQKRSAGSFIYGGEFIMVLYTVISALVPALLSHTYPQAGINKINILSFGPGLVMFIRWLLRNTFLLQVPWVINLDANFVREEDGVKKVKNVFFESIRGFLKPQLDIMEENGT